MSNVIACMFSCLLASLPVFLKASFLVMLLARQCSVLSEFLFSVLTGFDGKWAGRVGGGGGGGGGPA